MRDARGYVRTWLDSTPLVSLVVLCLLVALVGAAAVGVEVLNTWDYYFVMERTIQLATPVAGALAVVTILAWIGAVARAG